MSDFDIFDIDPGDFTVNEHGVWCPSCGEIIAAAWNVERAEEWGAPSECRTCGWPDDIDKMTEHFT